MEEKKIDFCFRKKLESTQIKVKGDIDVENLTKVLSLTAESNITNTDNINGEMIINGEVCFNVIYINEAGETKSNKNIAEFETKIVDDSFNAFITPIVVSNIEDTKILLANESNVKTEALVNLDLEIILCESFEPFESADFVSKKESLEIYSIYAKGNQRLNLQEGFDLKDKPNEILSVKAKLLCENYQAGTGYISLNGALIVSLVYSVNRDEKTEMRAEILRKNIKEEIEVSDLEKDTILKVWSDIRNCSINYNIDGSNVVLEIPIDIFYTAMKKSLNEIVVDAFSTTNETQITYDSITMGDKSQKVFYTDKIDGNLTIDEDQTRIARILSTCGERIAMTNILPSNNSAILEGIVYITVIYQIDDDNGTITSMEAELPFSIKVDSQFVDENDYISVDVVITDVNAKLKRGREINFDIELCFLMDIYNNLTEPIIKEVKISEEKLNNETNLQIYYAKKGDDLWNIAKRLYCEPDLISNQNKNLTFPLEKDQVIVNFKQNTK